MNEETITVAVRLRPIEKETSAEQVRAWAVADKKNVFLDERSFTFDHVFDTNATNADLLTVVKPLIVAALDGMNALIFTYGQTSSGKTHSIMGTPNDPGIIPQAIREIFNIISSREERTFALRVAYLQVYNEAVYDLLDPSTEKMKMHEVAGRFFVNSIEKVVNSQDEMIKIIERGKRHVRIAETAMNATSSRSHVLCDIVIEATDKSSVQVSHFYVVDLAGSERSSQTAATGSRLKESLHINKTLSVLISVLQERRKAQSYVRYRDSMLTRLLSKALAGNAKTLILATIKPAYVDESLATLKIADSAKLNKTAPRVNKISREMPRRQSMRRESLLQPISEDVPPNDAATASTSTTQSTPMPMPTSSRSQEGLFTTRDLEVAVPWKSLRGSVVRRMLQQLEEQSAQIAEFERFGHKMQEIEALLKDSEQQLLLQKATYKDLQKELEEIASQDEARSFNDKCSKLHEELRESKHVPKRAQRTMELDEALARNDRLERRIQDLEKELKNRTTPAQQTQQTANTACANMPAATAALCFRAAQDIQIPSAPAAAYQLKKCTCTKGAYTCCNHRCSCLKQGRKCGENCGCKDHKCMNRHKPAIVSDDDA